MILTSTAVTAWPPALGWCGGQGGDTRVRLAGDYGNNRPAARVAQERSPGPRAGLKKGGPWESNVARAAEDVSSCWSTTRSTATHGSRRPPARRPTRAVR